VLKYQAR